MSTAFQLKQQTSSRLRSFSLVFGALFLLALAPMGVFAQTTGSATLRGTIKDPAGAVVPNATVVIVSERTNAERRTVTSGEGTYTFASVDPGTYTLRVEGANFRVHQQTGLVLSPNDIRGVDVTLEIGAATETVTVTAENTPQIQTETGEKSNTITAQQIENLSIVGRSSMELLRIMPGVVAPDATQLEIVGFGSGANSTASYNVNGLRGTNNNVSIDGSRVIDIGSNSGTIITPNNDMVQEVKVQTSNYAAEFGTSGVQITATTKGGGNEFHGTLYTYARPYQLQANERQRVLQGYFANGQPKSPRPETEFYYPGGNIGGPVYLPRFGEGGKPYWSGKNRLFFFFAAEVQRQLTDAGVRTGIVPTLLQRQGDFSEFLPGGLYNRPGVPTLNQAASQFTIPGGFPGAGTAAPNGNLAPYIDPTGRALMNLYPLPNFTPTREQNYNYISSALQSINRVDTKLRFDYKATENTSIYLRLARETELQQGAFGIWWGPSTYELPSQNLGTNLGRSAALNITTVLNPTMTNEVVFSASKLMLDNDYENPERVSLGALGIQNLRLPFGNFSNRAPIAIYSWGQGLGNLWSGLNEQVFAHNASYSVTDNLTKIYNAHTFKFGGLIEQADKRQNFQNESTGAVVLGGPWSQNATGSDYGDLLVGRPTQFIHTTPSPVGEFRFYNIEGYAQDSWKVRPNFTLEYGLRVAYLPNNYERNGLDNRFEPSRYVRGAGAYINGDPNRPNGVLVRARGEVPKGAVENNPPQFAPRLNFAWDIAGDASTVIRGGAGLFYNRVMGNFQYDPAIRNPPLGYRSVSVQAYSGPSAYSDAQGDLTFNRLGLVQPFRLLGGLSLDVPDPESNFIPRIFTGSLSLARRLPFGNVFEASYVTTQGRHLPMRIQRNVIQPGTLLSGTIVDPVAGRLNLSDPLQRAALSGEALLPFRPFPDLGSIRYRQYNGTSSYHSLQATLSRQVGRRFTYFGTYTFSKVLGTLGSEYENVDPIDTRGRSYGVLDHDRTHIVNFSYNFNVPDLARGAFSNFLTKGLLNGWQMSGISTFQSGRPIRLRFTHGPLTQGNIALAYFGSDAFNTASGGAGSGAIAPVLSGNPQRRNSGNLGESIFDISTISIPSVGTSGPTVSPFYLRAPNRNNHDITLFKNFNFDGEGARKLQFRAGFFNIFNQAFPRDINVGDPNASDINLALRTECVRTVNGVPNGVGGVANNVCDPSGGFRFAQDTLENFGKVRQKRGRRIVELAVKFYF